jgi:hypothetical protein
MSEMLGLRALAGNARSAVGSAKIELRRYMLVRMSGIPLNFGELQALTNAGCIVVVIQPPVGAHATAHAAASRPPEYVNMRDVQSLPPVHTYEEDDLLYQDTDDEQTRDAMDTILSPLSPETYDPDSDCATPNGQPAASAPRNVPTRRVLRASTVQQRGAVARAVVKKSAERATRRRFTDEEKAEMNDYLARHPGRQINTAQYFARKFGRTVCSIDTYIYRWKSANANS